jgi:hypothetical protein
MNLRTNMIRLECDDGKKTLILNVSHIVGIVRNRKDNYTEISLDSGKDIRLDTTKSFSAITKLLLESGASIVSSKKIGK